MQKKVNGYKYWYIVESRRINGKPRPVVIEYLGTADKLLERLSRCPKELRLKSYAYGDVAGLLSIAQRLDIVETINKYINSQRKGFAEKPIRNNLTAGATYLLAAIGRCCMMTSKRGWYEWARTTALEYMLRAKFSKISSQHFWDLMDSLPEENIPKVESEIVSRVFEVFDLETDTMFYDTTNFYTFIASTNTKSTLAKRGKNKQKRNDLKQIGMALVVSKKDQIPLFHHTYPGNLNDVSLFEDIVEKIDGRIKKLGLAIDQHTFVLDRGNNSKTNLKILEDRQLYYVGALTPSHHQDLVAEAFQNLEDQTIEEDQSNYYRKQTQIWGAQRTVILFISDQLKKGQIRGILSMLGKKENQLEKLQSKLADPKSNRRNRKQITEQINNILNTQQARDLIKWELKWKSKGRYELRFWIDILEMERLQDQQGLRIIMTNRHNWTTEDIIKAYYGQSYIEKVFKELKNPYHLTVKPQFHWTDQKIKVHNFICVLGYLLTSLLYRQARKKADYQGSINTFLNELKNIRLGTILNKTGKHEKIKVQYSIEEMSDREKVLFEALDLQKQVKRKVKIKGFSVYN